MLFACLATMGLMPLIPDSVSPVTVAFAGLYLLFVACAAVTSPFFIQNNSLTWFFCAMGVSVLVARTNGVPAYEIFRGSVPFLFLVTFYVVAPFRTPQDRRVLACGIVLSAFVWGCKMLLVAAPIFFPLITGSAGRLSYYTSDALIPIGLVAFCLLLFSNPTGLKYCRWALFSLFGLLILLTMYRSQIVLALGLLITYGIRQRGLAFLVSAAALLAVAAAGYFLLPEAFVTSLLARFEETDLGDRGDEIRFAWSKFRESPVLGAGLGCPVPAKFIEGRDEDVGYVHNLWMYLLMDLGISGFLPYLLFFGGCAIQGLRYWRSRDAAGELRFAAAMGILTLLAFFTLQASYRLIHMNVALGLLAHICCCASPQVGASFPRKRSGPSILPPAESHP